MSSSSQETKTAADFAKKRLNTLNQANSRERTRENTLITGESTMENQLEYSIDSIQSEVLFAPCHDLEKTETFRKSLFTEDGRKSLLSADICDGFRVESQTQDSTQFCKIDYCRKPTVQQCNFNLKYA